jgi:hypothetical protein
MLKQPFNWKLFFVLLAGAIIGLAAIIPYSLALQGDAFSSAVAREPTRIWMLFTFQLATQVLFFAVVIWIGLRFAAAVGLRLPILENLLQCSRIDDAARRFLPFSIILGAILALLIIGLEVYVFQPALTAQLGENALTGASAVKPEAWKGFLASFYGAINEEILLRLCVMSFLVWLGQFASRTPDGKPTLAVLWIANILAAVLFGLGHLPATSMLVPLTPLVVARAIILNGLIGVGFGYLYFKHGLESAMLSHFSTDIVLHVIFAI